MKPIAVLAVLALSACATGTTPKATIAALESSLTTAETLADGYAKLPRCPAATKVCSDQATVRNIAAADLDAYNAIAVAEAMVATGGSPDLTKAQVAVAAFVTAVAALPKVN